MENIENKQFDEERALYNLCNARVINCKFEGPKDGESALKESRNIEVENCSFSLRYPLWHSQGFRLFDSKLDELTRAPIWYAGDGVISNTTINSVKAVRECNNIKIVGCDINSQEFGWKSNNINITDSKITSEYMLLDSKNIEIKNLGFKGKYSFQYVNNMTIDDSYLDTKDAFWHSDNVTVRNTVIKGEYLAWFSNNLTLINCKIIGTQPFCYCTNLKLIDCEMIDCDLAFEYSDVDAKIKGNVLSIKNPKSGHIVVDSVNEIINENSIMENTCVIDILEKEFN